MQWSNLVNVWSMIMHYSLRLITKFEDVPFYSDLNNCFNNL